MIDAADREMGEKRYLLTLDEIMDIQAMVFLGVVLGRKSLAESSPSDEWLEARAHHERTCQMLNDDWEDSFGGYRHLYECGICGESTALLCCINENGDTEWVKPKFCGYCGARVVIE